MMPSSCSHVRLKAATLSVVSARKVLLPPAEDGRAPPVFNAYGAFAERFVSALVTSHSMQSRQSTVVTITFLNAAGLTSEVQGSVSRRFTLIKTSQNPNFPPKYVSCPRPVTRKSRWKAARRLGPLLSPAASSTVPRRFPALPARVGRMGHPPVTWPTRFPRETSLASPCARARAHSKMSQTKTHHLLCASAPSRPQLN
jgi:hypothetical protein